MLRLGADPMDDGALQARGESVSFPGMSEGPADADGAGDAAGAGGAGDATSPAGGVVGGGGVPDLDGAYRSHFAELSRYVLRNFGGGPPDPEDVAQAAFLRLSGVSSVVENIGSFLRKTARNLVIDHYRGSLRTSLVLRDVTILEEENADFSPEDVLSHKEDLQVLSQAIDNLRPKERVALLMHRIDGASFAEIADHLGVSHSGARLLVSRAFERCTAGLGGPDANKGDPA